MAEIERLDGALQVVVFTDGGVEYGLGIDQVQEIILPRPITRVPRAPERIEGVINLQGNVIPVISLHRRLSLGQRTNSEQGRIIIVHRLDITVGIIVDGVKEVLNLSTGQIEPPAPEGMADMARLSGMGKISGRVILLLDLDNLLG
jgi:purine-binding chemotaxis protein CheW